MMTTPSMYPESQPFAQARGVLTWILGNSDSDPADRLAAGDALSALQHVVPADMIVAAAPETPGSLEDARRLLDDAAALETSVRGTMAVASALRHLRRAGRPMS